MSVAATTEPTPAPSGSREALSSVLCDVPPSQGAWGDREYLSLTDHTNRLIELTDGQVQELPMPTDIHQAVLRYLYLLFRDKIAQRGGVVRGVALRMRVREDYWPQRSVLGVILRYLAARDVGRWRTDDDDARLVAGAVENDHV